MGTKVILHGQALLGKGGQDKQEIASEFAETMHTTDSSYIYNS